MTSVQDGTGNDKTPTKILLVDDNPGDRRLVIEMLKLIEGSDYAVFEAATLEEAKASLPECEADVVLLDLALPDGTGVLNVETIRAINADVPILVLSGSEDERVTGAVLTAGATAFLAKMDLSDDMLREVLARVIKA